MPPGVTLRDIAKALGTSHSTVSRALHGSPDISAALRARILETSERMGYRPNPMAVALGVQRQARHKHTMAAELAWLNYWKDPDELRRFREFDGYWEGACEAAKHGGYHLEEFCCHGRISPSRLEGILLARNVQGILIPPHRPGDIPLDFSSLGWERFCVVKFGYSMRTPVANIVAGNHVTSGMNAFQNIRSQGYQRIGLASSEAVTSRFMAGFLMRQLDIPLRDRIPPLILPGPGDPKRHFPLVRKWMTRHEPDAILTDLAQFRQELERNGVKIPGDVALATTSILDGNIDSGIDQNSVEIGWAAVQMLVAQIDRNACGIPKIARELLIESSWVSRKHLPRKDL